MTNIAHFWLSPDVKSFEGSFEFSLSRFSGSSTKFIACVLTSCISIVIGVGFDVVIGIDIIVDISIGMGIVIGVSALDQFNNIYRYILDIKTY